MLTSTIFATEIGKSPDIAQSNCITHARQEEIKFASPCLPFGQVLLGLQLQRLGLVVERHLVHLRALLSSSSAVRLGAIGRHVSVVVVGSVVGGGAGGRTGGFGTGAPRRQQLRAFTHGRTELIVVGC